MSFTKGPWVAFDMNCGYQVKIGQVVVEADLESGPHLDAADAHLIAAAPTMYEALEELVRINEEWNESVQKIIGRPPAGVWSEQYLDKAKAALRKARNGS